MFNVLFRKHTSQIVKITFLLVLSTTTAGSTAGFTAVFTAGFTAGKPDRGKTAGKPNRR